VNGVCSLLFHYVQIPDTNSVKPAAYSKVIELLSRGEPHKRFTPAGGLLAIYTGWTEKETTVFAYSLCAFAPIFVFYI